LAFLAFLLFVSVFKSFKYLKIQYIKGGWMEENFYDEEKIKEEILKEAENSIVSINKFSTKYKLPFYRFQKIFWELAAEGKLVKLDTTLGSMFTSPNYLKKILGLS
jgi:hypothetical protein